MHVAYERSRAPRIAALAAALAVSLTACGDDPFSFDWDDAPDTAQIYSLARPELNIPTAFSFFDGLAYAVEVPNASGRWDLALDTQGGQLVLLPPGALGISARARVAPIPGVTYADVTQAPADTLLYEGDDPVPVEMGTVYVIRTNQRQGSFGSACTYYGKMEPVDFDVAGGSLTFRYVTSPICNSRDLVPPE
jgi:hypothetical protein